MFHKKKTLPARWVAIMNHRRSDRGLTLSPYKTRCVVAGDIHEFLVCAEDGAKQVIESVSYLGFAEFLSGGVLAIGDMVKVAESYAVRILGFDFTHMPNHMNIVTYSGTPCTGQEVGIDLDSELIITGM